MRVSSAHSLARSRSLVRVVYALKFFLMSFLIVSNTATAEPQKNIGQFAIDEVVKNIIELPQKAMTQGLNSVKKSVKKEISQGNKNENINKCEINGKITYQSKPCEK